MDKFCLQKVVRKYKQIGWCISLPKQQEKEQEKCLFLFLYCLILFLWAITPYSINLSWYAETDKTNNNIYKQRVQV